MKRTEHSAKTPSRRTGLFAMLRAFFRAEGTAAPSPAPAFRRAATAALLPAALGFFFLVAPPSASAAESAGPPKFDVAPPSPELELNPHGPYATRISAFTTLNPHGSPTEWRLEYGTSQSGPWTLSFVAPSAVIRGEIIFGEIHHLHPATTYYAHIVAKNAFGEAQATSKPFTTLPIGPPETLNKPGGKNTPENPGLVELARTTSSLTVTSDIETNGAPTEYRFEYSLPESGHVPVENSPSWQPFTPAAAGTVSVAQDFAT
ncbi:MAG TPA: hypothetical protein VNY83_02555, partial [Solirubrobacterales bacterium]|nr:hypothetical protein [Solirubrobacterales bacterium]